MEYIKKELDKESSSYLLQREKANARKRKFLDKMTAEQRELKKAKDREYYWKHKEHNKVKKIINMTEQEKEKIRKNWKEASIRYREKKKKITNIVDNTQI